MCSKKELENGHHDPETCQECQIDRNHEKLIELAKARPVTDKTKRIALAVLQRHLES